MTGPIICKGRAEETKITTHSNETNHMVVFIIFTRSSYPKHYTDSALQGPISIDYGATNTTLVAFRQMCLAKASNLYARKPGAMHMLLISFTMHDGVFCCCCVCELTS
jgi:hypothetical protein